MLEFEEYKAKLNAAKPTLEVLRGALKLEAASKEIEAKRLGPRTASRGGLSKPYLAVPLVD